MSLADTIVQLAVNGCPGAQELTVALVSKVKIVELTADEAEQVATLLRESRTRTGRD